MENTEEENRDPLAASPSEAHANDTTLPDGGHPKRSCAIVIALACAAVMALIALGMYMVTSLPRGEKLQAFVEEYTLVPEKVSKSAPIVVMLPEGIARVGFDPAISLSFAPEIAGKWETSDTEDGTYRFIPDDKLPVGAYYLAKLWTPEIAMEKMFSVDEDPTVLAIFPKEEVEVNEYSNITVMFSRPMVPLSTLTETESLAVPVTITPATEGRFKWITTSTLQFTPAKRLLRSSRYTVTVGDGLRSADGVVVPPFTHNFTTRTLDYVSQSADREWPLTLRHGEPFRIYFNQPIDLERTRPMIAFRGTIGSVPPAFVAVYGTRVVTDEKSGKKRVLTDQSVLEIYPERDTHGRSYLWDFGHNYIITVLGAVPLEGDVALTRGLERSFAILHVLERVSAQSKRSALAAPRLFDPEGTLTLHLGEPADLSASDIEGKGIAKLSYGEKCVEPKEGEEVYMNVRDCPKVGDKRQIVIAFRADAFAKGETSSVVVKKLVNESGLVLNAEPITEKFTTFPELRVFTTLPKEGAQAESLSRLTICTNSPLAEPLEEEFYTKVRANMMIGKWNWDRSFFVDSQAHGKDSEQCPVGTYQTGVRYGLVPKFAYELTLDLTDHFGQTLTKTLSFTTADADPLAKGIAHLQPAVVMTPPTRTTLAYGVDFMDEIDLTLCKVSAETMLRYRMTTPKATDDANTLSCVDRKDARLTLQKSYATRKYLTVDIADYYPEPKGHYVVVLSGPGYRRVARTWDRVTQKEKLVQGEQLFEKTYVTVTSLAVGAKLLERGDHAYYGRSEDAVPRESFMRGKWPTNLYWVTNFKSLSPVFGAKVTQYARVDGGTILNLPSATTDIEGIAETPSADNVVGAVVVSGLESAIVSPATDSFFWARTAGPARREYIYTDRPIYRPGDTVHVKGISRVGYDALFEIPTGTTKVEVRNARHEIARTEEVRFGKNGTYEFSFVLDPKAPLGYYPLQSTTGGYASFQVEEYVAPQFRVDVSSDKEEYISGDTATLNVSADYYFGVPVANADVNYRIVAQDYYFDRYRDAYFSFGRSWYESDGGWYGDRFITSGKLKLSQSGKGVITEKFSIDELFTGSYRNQSKVVTVYATAQNENGQSVSKEHSFILHRGEFYAGLVMDNYVARAGEKTLVRWKTVDREGKPLSVDDLTLSLEKVEWKSYKRQEVDGNFYYRSERVTTKVWEDEVNTNRSGDGSREFTAPEAGEYEFTISGKDGRGNTVSAQYAFYVSGHGSVSIRPTNNESLELVAEKTELSVGDTASFVIKSPFERAKALVTVMRGDIYERRIVDVNTQLAKYEFPVTERHIPNVVASVLLLSSAPEVKYGEMRYQVGTKEKELSVIVTPEKKRYLPGEEVKLDILVTDAKGALVSAELSLAVVDMSVLALVGNPKKDPVLFFYRGEPITIRTAMNVKNVLHEAEIPLGTKGGSGGGGDDLEKKKRGVFRDTAYWEGVIETDASGKASVRFTLPDNLTEWQAESVAVTRDTKLGVGYGDFVARKTIMALPLKPRFILPSDTFAIGGTVFNESDEKQRLEVSIHAPTLTMTGSTKTNVAVDPHSSVSISFPAKAPEGVISGKHEFTLSAKNEAYEDVVVGSFPVERNDTYESTVTAGRVTGEVFKEYLYLPKNVVPDRGGLTLSLAATMASVLDDAIRGMLIYPYECSEQVASKLRTIAIVKENARLFGIAEKIFAEKVVIGEAEYTLDEIVERGLAKLYENQGPDGGMPYYMNLPPDFQLTVATLETYIDLKRAGYKVDEGKLTESARYVFNYLNFPRTDRELSQGEVIFGAYVLAKLGREEFSSAGIDARLLSYVSDRSQIGRSVASPSLAYLAILSVKKGFDPALTERLFAEFANRSQIDARGTTVRTNVALPLTFAENAVTNTALALKAFSEAKKDTPLLEGYLRSLRSAKTKTGGWASTWNSITVIDAVTAYLTWKKEADAHFSVAVALGETPLFAGEFGKKNVRETFATTVPLSALPRGAVKAIEFVKKNLGSRNDAYYYDLSLKYYLPAESIAPRDEGMSVSRAFYRIDDTDFAHPITSAVQGEVLLGRVVITTPKPRFHVTLEDFIPAGVEIVNRNLATEDQSLGNKDGMRGYDGGYEYYGGYEGAMGRGNWLSRGLAAIFSSSEKAGPMKDTDGAVDDAMYGNKKSRVRTLYPSAIEAHDDRIFAYVTNLSAGEYVYEYYVRALVPGEYQHLPAVASELYAPENFGRTQGAIFTVTKK